MILRTVALAAAVSILGVPVIANVSHADQQHSQQQHSQQQHTQPSLPVWATRACHAEGDVNCHWDAATQGNHAGHSYIVRAVPGRAHMVCVFYTQTRFAASHDYCS